VKHKVAKSCARIALAVSGIAVFGVVLGRLFVGGPLSSWVTRDVDAPARRFSVDHENAALTAGAEHISAAGNAWVAGSVAVVIALGWWIRTRDPRPAFVLVSAFLGAGVVTIAVKYGVRRAPASHPTSRVWAGSFPSGHTLFALSVYGALAVLIIRGKSRTLPLRVAVAVAFLAVPVAVACGRVYLLDHYLSDVAGSLVLGVALIAASVAIVGRAPPDTP
jgi:membrane-associated phospholipid phosphatase